jgi:hypothetical protein
LLRDIFSGSEFLQGNTNTSFLKTVYPNGFIKYNLKEEEKMQLMVIAVIIKQKLLEWKSLWTPTQVEGVDLVSPQYATEKTPEEVKYHVSIDQSSPSLVTLRSAQGKTRVF